MVAKAACGKIKNLKRKKKSFDGALKTVLEFKAQLIAAKLGKQGKTSV